MLVEARRVFDVTSAGWIGLGDDCFSLGYEGAAISIEVHVV